MIYPKNQKEEKEKSILLGLVELYVMTGKPVGSKTLKERGFESISSATIRNYFTKLEKEGFLAQKHTSGGRVPTTLAYKFYAEYHRGVAGIKEGDFEAIRNGLDKETSEIVRYLQDASHLLSDLTQGAIFLSSPRFDRDLVSSVKLMAIDSKRYLCVLVTDFGLIHTEILHSPKKLSNFALKRIEKYFCFRITGLERPTLSIQEERIASDFYNEILLRHVIDYSNFSAEDVYKTGFSKLLHFFEFQDKTALLEGLSIFENLAYVKKLLKKCTESRELLFWIGDDLVRGNTQTSVIAVPYSIHGKPVGSVALLGPIRMPYPKIFGIMRAFSATLSDMLTRNLSKYKITYRLPQSKAIDKKTKNPIYLSQVQHLLLEDQS